MTALHAPRRKLRLGVNIDHVATIRNARGGKHPDPIRAARVAERAGADGITAHLREDRRHISDDDIARLVRELTVPLNLEMAATEAMLAIALKHKPHAACLVPERRAELTTEGGLDVAGATARLKPFIAQLAQAGIRVSLFIDPDEKQLDAAKSAGAPVVEIHTGKYADAASVPEQQHELERIKRAVAHGHALGLQVNAGHGLSYVNLATLLQVPHLVELNIGHSLISRSITVGLSQAVKEMLELMKDYAG